MPRGARRSKEEKLKDELQKVMENIQAVETKKMKAIAPLREKEAALKEKKAALEKELNEYKKNAVIEILAEKNIDISEMLALIGKNGEVINLSDSQLSTTDITKMIEGKKAD